MKINLSSLKKYYLLLLDIVILFCIPIVVGVKSNSYFIEYTIIFWVVISLSTNFYDVNRYTNWSTLIDKSIKQFFTYSLAYFAYFGVVDKKVFFNNYFLQILIATILLISTIKFVVLFIQRQHRLEGNDPKKIILFGNQNSAFTLENLFKKNKDLGYTLLGFFSDKRIQYNKYLGSIKDGFNFIIDKEIDEIFCDPNSFSPNKLSKIRKFAIENNLELSYIPENKAIYSKDLVLENYGTFTILKAKPLPFEKVETHIVKRVFDLIFSLIVFILILSWLLPILAIIIKIDSKGPVFFKQIRDGEKGKQFYCFKLRSMRINNEADKLSASKNDKRITKVGAFLRKTSLDELPQFINVFLGDMSVVGPRPHMNLQTKKYEREVANYLLRHEVKPGITGLAQISGYRGEVIEKSDILNRVRLDIFYIENWTFILDLKIIAKTFINVFLKEEKAY